MTKTSFHDGSEMKLIFSDEFNKDGRSFYPGDDPYWEATDLNYWQTGNLEWYDPAAITTKDGALRITLSKKDTHDLHYEGGMMSSWNQFCFTGGYIEAAVTLPGRCCRSVARHLGDGKPWQGWVWRQFGGNGPCPISHCATSHSPDP